MKTTNDRDSQLYILCKVNVMVLALLTLILASCGEGFRPLEEEGKTHEEILEETRDCLDEDPPAGVFDTTGAHWLRARRLVREDRIPKEPLLLGVVWEREKDVSGPFFLTFAWLKRERPPSSIRKVRLKVGDKKGNEHYEFKILSLSWSSRGYIWSIQEAMSVGDVSGIEFAEPVDHLGSKLLHLKISEETFEKGVWLSVVDEDGRSSNYLKIREYAEWKEKRETEQPKE